MTDRMKRYLIIAALLVGAGLVLFGSVALFVQSTHPDKKVRDGVVVEHKFDPAHDDTYWVQVYDGQTCFTTGSGTNQTRTCTNHYHPEQRTDHIPDRWYIRVEGCKRYRADAPIEYCTKKSKRRMQVTQADYNALPIGAKWTEAP